MRTFRIGFIAVLAALVVGGCVDHRPIRNGLKNEHVYLDKSALTAPEEGRDEEWLYKVTVVQASSPNVLGDYAFPGFESGLKLVRFRFAEDALQVLDAWQLQEDDPDDPNDDLATRTDRVLLEFEGEHVDVKLRESLDGERTNFLEENTEEPWQRRQKFKVDFETTSMDPVSSIAWFYGDFVSECASQTSANLVPGSYEFDEENDHLSFVVEVNYALNVSGGCYDLVSLATGTGTASIRYRMSFHRRAENDYEPVVIEEKDEVNKKYGSFQVLAPFRDPDTGLLDAHALLQRWDPNREEPVTFYFHEGFPPKFKPMFDEIADETNAILEEAGASLRFRFADWNEDGIERQLGDIRYSFVVWHQDIDTTRGLLGYGPSSADPRTGEVLSANLHLYNVGQDYYRYLIQAYLEDHGARTEGDTPWEEQSCEPGETVAPAEVEGRLSSGLFTEMRRVMELPEPESMDEAVSQLVPEPTRGEDEFLADYHRTLGELRYVRPEWNDFVYQTGGNIPLDGFQERLAVDRAFNDQMHSILMNENPFGPIQLHGRQGIEALNQFSDDFRYWRKNHELLKEDQEFLLGRHNIYTFNANDAIAAIATGARRCTDEGRWESDEEYTDRIVEAVTFNVAIHEFGHNLSLRHNFYGSVDKLHQREHELSASVMDYVRSQYEAGSARNWGMYDEAALKWIYGTPEVQEEVMQEDMLFCTDQHRFRSPLCTAHDLGVTPSQIALNAIEQYDWLYSIRNRRAFRKFWDTYNYSGQIYSSIFPLQRLWYLGIFDWGGGGVQDTLKRLDQVDPDREVLTDPEYDARSIDFYNEVAAANEMIAAFYDAVINQPASLRNYQTEFDPYYGDVLRLGIVLDKLYAAYAFMDLQNVYNYDPNIQTYIAMYDAPFGAEADAISQRVLDDMLGSNYDTFPWFRYLGINLFASATNSNLVGRLELKDRIAIRRYENEEEFVFDYGEDALFEATARDNPAQLFVHDGEQYAYSYLPDQGWHLVSSRSRSPVSFEFMKNYNEDLNSGRFGNLDNYGLKILLAYYEYYNNFVGF